MSTITKERYEELKQEVERASRAADRAKGALDQTIKRLKEDFGCKNLKEAKDKLAALELQAETAKQKFEVSWKDYKQKYNS